MSPVSTAALIQALMAVSEANDEKTVYAESTRSPSSVPPRPDIRRPIAKTAEEGHPGIECC